MIDVQIDGAAFAEGLRRSMAQLRHDSERALRHSVALALSVARTSHAFKNRTGELRRSIVSGQRGQWSMFLKATAKHARFIEFGTKPHIIRARKAKALRFVQAGEVRFAKWVKHPGTKPRPFMQSAADEGEFQLVSMLTRAVQHALN